MRAIVAGYRRLIYAWMPQAAANLRLPGKGFSCRLRSMAGELLMQGRMVTSAAIDLVRQLPASHRG